MSGNTRPVVSVLLPVRNGRSWIEGAIHSVLIQTLESFELVVVDDNSTDGTSEVVERFVKTDGRVRSLSNHSGAGLVEALNFGLTQCRAPLVARLDADDLMERERLLRQVQEFRDPRVVVVGSNVTYIAAEGAPTHQSQLPHTEARILHWLKGGRCPFAHPSVTFRRDNVLEAGGYHGAFPHAEDFELWCRLSQRGRMVNLRAPLTRYRLHDGQISRTRAHAQQLATLRATRRHFPEASGLLGFLTNSSLTDCDLDLLASILRATAGEMDCPDDVRPELVKLARLVSDYRVPRHPFHLDLFRGALGEPRLTLLALLRAMPYIRRSALHALRR